MSVTGSLYLPVFIFIPDTLDFFPWGYPNIDNIPATLLPF